MSDNYRLIVLSTYQSVQTAEQTLWSSLTVCLSALSFCHLSAFIPSFTHILCFLFMNQQLIQAAASGTEKQGSVTVQQG